MQRRNFIALALGWLGLSTNPTPEKLVRVVGRLTPPRRCGKLRVWTLGDPEHKLLPKRETFDRLVALLQEWDGESSLDVVWGPDLHVQQFDLEGPESMDVVAPPRTIEVDKVEQDENGALMARLTLREPHVRIIRREPKPKDE